MGGVQATLLPVLSYGLSEAIVRHSLKQKQDTPPTRSLTMCVDDDAVYTIQTFREVGATLRRFQPDATLTP